jgi:hypothetical protein
LTFFNRQECAGANGFDPGADFDSNELLINLQNKLAEISTVKEFQ